MRRKNEKGIQNTSPSKHKVTFSNYYQFLTSYYFFTYFYHGPVTVSFKRDHTLSNTGSRL